VVWVGHLDASLESLPVLLGELLSDSDRVVDQTQPTAPESFTCIAEVSARGRPCPVVGTGSDMRLNFRIRIHPTFDLDV